MKRNHIISIGIIAIITAAIAFIELSKPNSSVVVSDDKSTGITIGKTAPDFELETLEGKKAKLSDYRGKKVILNFWASWCPPCREEMPEFQRIYSENKDKLVVVGVNLQENRENAERFYPFRILVCHEIVNDFIQNDPILVTYCPLCFTGIGFIREIDNETVEFGVSGKLYNSELVMYDRKTDSYWPQTLGKAVLGPSIGKTIKKIPTDTVKWGDWKKVHSDTEVLSKDTGFSRNYDGSNPYGEKGDFTDINLQFPIENKDSRLNDYEIVYGIELNGKFKAYKKSDLEQISKIEDAIGEEKIIIEFDKSLKSARAYKDDNEQLTVDTLFWFAWAAFHPETEVYKLK